MCVYIIFLRGWKIQYPYDQHYDRIFPTFHDLHPTDGDMSLLLWSWSHVNRTSSLSLNAFLLLMLTNSQQFENNFLTSARNLRLGSSTVMVCVVCPEHLLLALSTGCTQIVK